MQFEAGSMAPKVEAAVEFARASGSPAAIGRLEAAGLIVAGECGTRVAVRREAVDDSKGPR